MISSLRRLGAYWVISLLLGYGAIAQQPYEQQITIPANLDKEVLESVRDMASWLDKATGSNFAVRETGQPGTTGIVLQWAEQANLSSGNREKLNRDGQTFHLEIDGDRKAVITGTGTNSFINGIYTFLQELGFHWYMPGDTWVILPKSISRSISLKKTYTPDFENRDYDGSGGLRPIPEVDPDNSFLADYNTWNRRNRYSNDYTHKGHTGHLFYSANKQELDKNPGWFCNDKIDPYGRIDISKPAVVDLYVQWALNQVKPTDRFPVIGVDPSDGSGGATDCLPKGMPGITSWSDKYFWLANKVAASLPENDNKTKVELYAYGAHAALPSFDLKKQVYPVIIPYAFQRVTTPENFIKKWHQKLDGRPMGIYDYWNITQWSIGLPQFNIYTIPERLRLWKEYNITTIYLESTNAKGPMGHALCDGFADDVEYQDLIRQPVPGFPRGLFRACRYGREAHV